MSLKKTFILLLLFLFFSPPLFSENPQFPSPFPEKYLIPLYREKLKQSLETWKTYLARCGSDYVYSVYKQSWSHWREKTTLSIKKNRVTARKFERMKRDFDRVWHQETWNESEDGVQNGVGTHDEGAKPLTVEELHTQCAQRILTQNTRPENLNNAKNYHFIHFRTDSRGLLYECLAWNNDCRGDCWQGVRIHDVSFDACPR